MTANRQRSALQRGSGHGRLREEGGAVAKRRAAPQLDQRLGGTQAEVVAEAGEHHRAGGVDVQWHATRQRGHVGRQTLEILLAHVQQQAQLGEVVEPASGAAIRRVEAEVGVVFGAQLAAGLLVGVEPVEQALRIGRADLQAQQQPAELLDGGGIGLLIAQQVVEVEAPGHILDAHEDLARSISNAGSGWARGSSK